MSQYPPPSYSSSGRYSPGRPAYSDRPPFPPTLPAAPPRDYSAYPYPAPTSAPPPPAPYRPYDPYSSEARPVAPYPQPRDPYASESYDPYSPSTAYNPTTPAIRFPPSSSPPLRHELPPIPRPMARAPSPPAKRVAQSAPKNLEAANDLPMLTAPISAEVHGINTAIYSLPPSHLPIDKYIAVNPGDCVDIHRALCIKSKTVWYADGCSRAGEGWSAAIEWIIAQGQSGRKMRGCIPGADGLESELHAICKAVEGFHDLLDLSIKEGTPRSHELIVFCDSAAAIVSIDTSSRPESLRFEQLWRAVCSEYSQAHLTFVWLPKNSGIEGHVLSDKIAVVAASNSYLKKKKEGSLPEVYRRATGGEALPSGSTEPGPWQRGDADPSRRKEQFERPRPVPISPPKVPVKLEEEQEVGELQEQEQDQAGEMMVRGQMGDGAEGAPPPPREAIFVTSFPDSLSAKDIGVLYAQFGELVSVDIYHTHPSHPRFAYVQYTNIESGDAAIAALNERPIDFSNAYARENAADLADWQGWQGHMKAVRNEADRFIPSSVVTMFPGVVGWMVGDDPAETARKAQEEEEKRRKRERSHDPQTNGAALQSTASSVIDSPSPHKRPRQASSSAPTAASGDVAASAVKPIDFAAQLSDLVTKADTPWSGQNVSAPTAVPASAGLPPRPNGAPTFTPPPGNLPPFPPSIGRNDKADRATPQPPHLAPAPQINGSTPSHSVLPPTPQTAERALPASLPARPISPVPAPQLEAALLTPNTAAPPTLPSAAPTSASQPQTPSTSSGRPPLTNSAAEPQEYPILLSVKTLQSQLSLVSRTFVKHDINNWIAHSCLIAVDMDQARRALQADLFATDEGFLTGRELEQQLAQKGFTAQRVDAFITKVLKVLDGIAMAEALGTGEGVPGGGGKGGNGLGIDTEERRGLVQELQKELEKYPDQTKEAVASAGTTLEYLHRGKELQEKKRLDVERRVKVLEGMVKIGEVVSGVVRFLLTEGAA